MSTPPELIESSFEPQLLRPAADLRSRSDSRDFVTPHRASRCLVPTHLSRNRAPSERSALSESNVNGL
jgi:hypothetical protein